MLCRGVLGYQAGPTGRKSCKKKNRVNAQGHGEGLRSNSGEELQEGSFRPRNRDRGNLRKISK